MGVFLWTRLCEVLKMDEVAKYENAIFYLCLSLLLN